MSQPGRLTGKDLVISLGGVSLEGDFTSVSVSDEADLVEATAGADQYHYFLNTARRNGTVDVEVHFDKSDTTVWDALAPGSSGTLIIGPAGTAMGNPKWTWSDAIVQSRSVDMPFDDVISVSASIQLNSLVSESTY